MKFRENACTVKAAMTTPHSGTPPPSLSITDGGWQGADRERYDFCVSTISMFKCVSEFACLFESMYVCVCTHGMWCVECVCHCMYHACWQWEPKPHFLYFGLLDQRSRSLLVMGCQEPWPLPWRCHTAIFFCSPPACCRLLAAAAALERKGERKRDRERDREREKDRGGRGGDCGEKR